VAHPKLSKLELQIMEALWMHGASSVREVQERFPQDKRPRLHTVQTMIYRMEAKKVLRRVKKISTRTSSRPRCRANTAQRRLIDDLLGLFGGRMQPVMAHLVETGKLTLEDVQMAEKRLRELADKKKERGK